MRISDWSSDVCSSDLHALKHTGQLGEADAAYAVASQSCPGQMEPLKCPAHLARDTGRIADAIGYFPQLLESELGDTAAAEIILLNGAASALPADKRPEILKAITPLRIQAERSEGKGGVTQ